MLQDLHLSLQRCDHLQSNGTGHQGPQGRSQARFQREPPSVDRDRGIQWRKSKACGNWDSEQERSLGGGLWGMLAQRNCP